jgi:hypothetical protein
MSRSFIRFTPGASLTGRWRLRVTVNMADTARGSSARLTVHNRSGGSTAKVFPLNRSGAGTHVYAFSRASVANLELDLVNASIRFKCGQGTLQSCQGLAYDDDLQARFSAQAIR